MFGVTWFLETAPLPTFKGPEVCALELQKVYVGIEGVPI